MYLHLTRADGDTKLDGLRLVNDVSERVLRSMEGRRFSFVYYDGTATWEGVSLPLCLIITPACHASIDSSA